MKVFLIAFTLMIVLYFKEKGLSVESALSFINWPVLQMIPGSRMADCGIQVGFTRSDNSECNLYCDLFGVYGVHCCGGVQNEM